LWLPVPEMKSVFQRWLTLLLPLLTTTNQSLVGTLLLFVTFTLAQ
jgi:hypothetical protein